MKFKIILRILLLTFTLPCLAQWTDNGTIINTTDNVEIKGASDDALLTVIENNSSTRRRINIGASNNEVYIQHLYGTSGVPFNFKVSGSNVLTLNSLNVGIGTITPQAKFTIQQIGNGWNDGLRINRDATNYLTLTEDVNDIRLKNWGNGDIRFYTSTVEAIRILNNGSTGIGTSPQAKFTIQQIGNGWNDGLRINRDATNYLTLTEDVNDIRLKNWGNGGIRFYTSTVEAIRILNDGKVGIGTVSTGSHKLAVEGSIGAREFKVEATGWSDFVFFDDYKLPTLQEVEKHIKEKGHLKDIPSAKEVEKNGIFLGKMDAKLLQKIEELTLYTIQQERKLKSQDLKIEKLEKENKLLKSFSERLLAIEEKLKSKNKKK